MKNFEIAKNKYKFTQMPESTHDSGKKTMGSKELHGSLINSFYFDKQQHRSLVIKAKKISDQNIHENFITGGSYKLKSCKWYNQSQMATKVSPNI